MAKPSTSAAEVVRRQRDGLHDDSTRSNGSLFHYATAKDKIILVLSTILAVIAGALNPLLTVVYGQLINAFNGFAAGTTKSSDLRSTIAQFTLYYVYCAIGIFVFIYIATVGFYYVGERIARALRRAYLKAVISQNMAFFDNRGNGEITVSIMSDMGTIQEAITSKISVAMTALANFASAFVIMYVVSWRTALILSPTFLVMLGVVMACGSYAVKHHKQAMGSQAQAASLAEESIASVREVTAFGIQGFLVAKYHSFLEISGRSDVKSRDSVTYMIAWSNAMPCLVYALSFWVGSIFLVRGQTSVSAIATTTLAIIISAFAIIRVAPSFQALTATVAGSSKILSTIARRSPQDPFSSEGKYLQDVAGEITFRDVSLTYPSREDVVVLDRVNIRCPAGKTTAIVGPSGSGKSSVVSLLERYYEPTEGVIELDGHDLQSLNLRNLRSHVSIVEQDVALFDTTIFENIRYGLLNSNFQGTQEDLRKAVVQAATDANAHQFISTLANGYDTMVGQAGTQLSGGQRQRIALARALIKQPSILLLDEATSALDSKSEAVVQQALDSAAKNRTTIMIAHRLSTVRNADQIIVMEGGLVMEKGTHTELMELHGLYAGMVQNQQVMDAPGQSSQVPAQDLTSEHGISLLEKPALHTAEAGIPPVENIGSPKTQERPQALGLMSTLKFIYDVNAEEKGLLAVGTASAIIAGFGIPIQSIFFAKLLDSLSLDPVALRQSVNFWAGLYVMMAGVAFICWSALGLAFARSTEALSRRAKRWALESILSQDMEFFDRKDRSTGALLEVVTGSTEQLSSLSGPVIGSVLTFLSTILAGIIISLVIGWKLALVCTATIPIVVACGWIRLRMLAVFDGQVKETGKEAASYASETVRLVRTVASLGIEDFALDRYDEILSQRAATSLRSMLSASALYAASQSVVFLCAALAFWYGGQLVSTGEYSVFQFYICFVALISGAQTAGSIFSYAPDASKAMHASHELKTLLESKSRIILEVNGHSNEEKRSTDGIQLELSNVDFQYPSRPDHQVLQNFNLTINAGQYLALVGPSGCGKSTVLALLERFYDPDKGVVRVDGVALPALNVQQHRQNVSLVSQGAALYSGTIRENIALGRRSSGGSDMDTTDEDIMDVCKQANIHDFISSLPDGLSTVLGPRGTLVSGGQRQRIAIARALIRQPQILLLDEATSALDPESERLVQEALDRAAHGRTTISVAHRLSSIRAAHKIYVLDAGKIVESGNHEELMAMRGAYWDLVKMQNLQ